MTPWGWGVGPRSPTYLETDLPQGQVLSYPPPADVPGSHSSLGNSNITQKRSLKQYRIFLFLLGASQPVHQNFVHALIEFKFHFLSYCLLLCDSSFIFPLLLFFDITVSLLILFDHKCSLYLSFHFKKMHSKFDKMYRY
jgi:hypothetical protein